ncbi:DUF1810 domain-containing protein [Spirosoma flavum]|uniref:DUF1810 domain-containing protein n=1 Tax=Spirosoma flavum TaxID=2048557 RepID=A0ABW6ALM1_9BACT
MASPIRNGRKQSQWMWSIVPQLAGLGVSETARFYAIKDLQEVDDFLKHPRLGSRLIKISNAMLQLAGKSAHQILGNPDQMKLHVSMTLFILLNQTDPLFQAVLATYLNSLVDQRTLTIVNNSSSASYLK